MNQYVGTVPYTFSVFLCQFPFLWPVALHKNHMGSYGWINFGTILALVQCFLWAGGLLFVMTQIDNPVSNLMVMVVPL